MGLDCDPSSEHWEQVHWAGDEAGSLAVLLSVTVGTAAVQILLHSLFRRTSAKLEAQAVDQKVPGGHKQLLSPVQNLTCRVLIVCESGGHG